MNSLIFPNPAPKKNKNPNPISLFADWKAEAGKWKFSRRTPEGYEDVEIEGNALVVTVGVYYQYTGGNMNAGTEIWSDPYLTNRDVVTLYRKDAEGQVSEVATGSPADRDFTSAAKEVGGQKSVIVCGYLTNTRELIQIKFTGYSSGAFWTLVFGEEGEKRTPLDFSKDPGFLISPDAQESLRAGYYHPILSRWNASAEAIEAAKDAAKSGDLVTYLKKLLGKEGKDAEQEGKTEQK